MSLPYHWRFVRHNLSELCREERFGNDFLPEDDEGRNMLVAFLCIGESDEVAIKFAPWCEAELPALRARRIKWTDIGKLIGLTTRQLENYNLWCFGLPVDKTAEEFEAWKIKRLKDQAKARQKEYRKRLKEQKERRLARAKAQTNPRHAAILKMVTDPRSPVTAPEIVRNVCKSRAYQRHCSVTYCNGPPAKAMVKNPRMTVHRDLDQLEDKGTVKTEMRRGKYGPVRWVWLVQEAEIGLAEASHLAVTPSHHPSDRNGSDYNNLQSSASSHAACRVWERDALSDSDATPEQAASLKALAGSELSSLVSPTTLEQEAA